MSIFKAYDIRGIYGQDLVQDDFYKIARAYAQFCGFSGKGKVVFADTLAVGEATETNVVLADSVGETDKEKIIVVKLTKGFIRDDVNLSDHPENLGHRLTVNGNLKPYNSLPGIVDVMGGGRREDLLGVPIYVHE